MCAVAAQAQTFSEGGLGFRVLKTYQPFEDKVCVEVETVSESFVSDARANKVLSFPESVEHDGKTYIIIEIADNIFKGYDLSAIEEVVFPQSLHTPGDNNYENMPNIKRIVFGDEMLSTGKYNFNNMPLLQNLELPDGMEHTGSSLCNIGIEELRLPDRLGFMRYSLSVMPHLKKLDLNSVRTLNYCLCYLDELEEVSIPATLTTVDESLNDMPAFRKLVIEQRDTYLSFYESLKKTECFRDVYVENETPFELILSYHKSDNPFPSEEPFEEPFPTRTVLHVPKGCREAYAADPVWGTFSDIVEYDKASLKDASMGEDDIRIVADNGAAVIYAPEGENVSVISTCGTTVYAVTMQADCIRIAMPRGIYIVKAGDRTMKIRI